MLQNLRMGLRKRRNGKSECDCCVLKTEEDAPMVTVLVATDAVYNQMVAIFLEKKGNRDPFVSRSLAAFARYVGHPKVIIQGDSEHALVAVIHDACALLTAATPRTSFVNSKGSNGAAERAVQPVEGMARTLRLDLGRTNIAVGSGLPITFWRVRHAAWLLSHFQTGSADGKTAYARQLERPSESVVLPLAERVMWKDPTLQPAQLKSSWGDGLWLERLQASNAHLIGTRVGIVVIVVPASSGAPLQAGSGEGVSASSNPVPNLLKPTVARAQPSSAAVESGHHPSGERVDSAGPGDVPMDGTSCGTDNEVTRSSGGAR